MLLVHGSCVALGGRGVLLRGASGAGKSDLALRLIDTGARLVADDQVALDRRGDAVVAHAPEAIAGLIEVRGLGILRLDHLPEAALALVVDLVEPPLERMPRERTAHLLDVALPNVSLDPWELSSASKVRLAMRVATGTIMSPQC